MADRVEVDLTAINSNVMLVKVPKYISKRWDKVGPGGTVGKLRVTSKLNKRDFTFVLKPELANLTFADDDVKIPQEHLFKVMGSMNKTAMTFSEASKQGSSGENSATKQTAHICLEGQVAERMECRPIGVGGSTYMNMKKLQITRALQPVRTTKHLVQRPVIKPTSNHHINSFFDKKKEGKKARLDRDKVLDMLFKAFEKHQFYSFKDLMEITQQPSPYLKEILKDIGSYNTRAPHKFMWELKVEYRHYKSEENPASQP